MRRNCFIAITPFGNIIFAARFVIFYAIRVAGMITPNFTAQLVFSNHQDICSDYSHQDFFKWMKATKKHLNRPALLLYNAAHYLEWKYVSWSIIN